MFHTNRTKRITLLALFVSLAMVLSIVESMLPTVPIYGVKLGLANIITVLVIVMFGYKDAFAVVFVRCVLISLMFGGPTILMFSLTGGLLSTFVMCIMYRYLRRFFSIIGISIAGSIAHNIGQILIACLLLQEMLIITYLPVLLIAGVITGILVGIISNLLIEALNKTKLLKG